MVDKQVDILIVGGGLTGAVLLLALANKGYSTLLVDNKPLRAKVSAHFDARTLALAPASIRILQTLSLWPLLQSEATPIQTIHVSDQHHFGAARLKSTPDNPLGYVVEMQWIHQALQQLVDEQSILAPATLSALDKKTGLAIVHTEAGELAVQAQLVVAADGTESTVRHLIGLAAKTKSYAQQALIANIGLARDHNHCAYERFTRSGPLALLPMTNKRAALVWALNPEEAQQLLAADEQSFLTALQKAFGYRLGRFVRVGQRHLYPLQQVIMPEQTAWPFVFVGNACHTLHPVAGQGFNLGLRDVATLAQCILQEGLHANMLQTYQTMRQHDQQAIIGITDGIIKVFSSRLPGMALVRNLGLIAIDNLPFLKRYFARYTRGFAGITPDLVCGITIKTAEKKESYDKIV